MPEASRIEPLSWARATGKAAARLSSKAKIEKSRTGTDIVLSKGADGPTICPRMLTQHCATDINRLPSHPFQRQDQDMDERLMGVDG
jgi:hypothetical protein